MGSAHPARGTKPVKEDGVVTIAKGIVQQMGSDPSFLSKQKIDARKFAVLNPYTQAAMGHFNYRAKVGKIRYFAEQVNWELNSTPSISGLRARQVIQLIAAAAGRLLDAFDNGVTAIVTNPRAMQRDRERLEALKAATVQLPD